MNKKIAVLFHKRTNRLLLKKYLVAHMAECWKRQGLDVEFLFGTDHFVPAQLCIVHVDLSVVPDTYIEFARRYPRVLNDNVRDIRKSTISNLLITRECDYAGKVIVKSDLNYAGWPEKIATSNYLMLAAMKLKKSLGIKFGAISSQSEYGIYDNKELVPLRCWKGADTIVEKFITNREGDEHYVHFYKFFGNNHEWAKNYSPNPVVTSFNTTSRKEAEPQTEILEFRRKIRIDFGKIDYCMDGATPVVIDVNKTPGTMGKKFTPAYQKLLQQRANGIRDFL